PDRNWLLPSCLCLTISLQYFRCALTLSGALATKQIAGRCALCMATITKGKAAARAFAPRVRGIHFTVPGRDYETIFVVGNRHGLVHVLDQLTGQADLFQHSQI